MTVVIGRQLKQSVNVFHSLMLYRLLHFKWAKSTLTYEVMSMETCINISTTHLG